MSAEVLEGFRLSPQQRAVWRGAEGEPLPAARCAIAIDGPLDVARLRRAIDQSWSRHEVLRTYFPILPGMSEPLQVIGEPRPVALSLERPADEAGELRDPDAVHRRMLSPRSHDLHGPATSHQPPANFTWVINAAFSRSSLAIWIWLTGDGVGRQRWETGGLVRRYRRRLTKQKRNKNPKPNLNLGKKKRKKKEGKKKTYHNFNFVQILSLNISILGMISSLNISI